MISCRQNKEGFVFSMADLQLRAVRLPPRKVLQEDRKNVSNTFISK